MPQRIIFPKRGQAVLREFALPPLNAGSVRLRTLHSLMSIGTETAILHQRYAPGTHYDRIFSFPQLKTGVQAVAEVEAVGAEVRDFAVGDRAYMRMAHGSHQVLPEAALSPVPEGVDAKSACWCGLAKTAFRAAWAAPFRLGLHLLVIGAGPVGQMAVRWARSANVGHLAVSDLSAQRLAHAANGGASQVLCGDVKEQLAEIGAMNGGAGPDLVVEATGSPAVFSSALAAAARYGKVILLGDTGFPDRQRLSSDVMTKGLCIQATHDSHDRDGWTQRRIDELFFASVLAGRFDLSGLISHEFSPADCAAAYALAEENRGETMGVLFDWSQAEW